MINPSFNYQDIFIDFALFMITFRSILSGKFCNNFMLDAKSPAIKSFLKSLKGKLEKKIEFHFEQK